MKNKKRVKPYIVIPIYAAVIALLTKMVSTCTDQYIDNRIYDQQINNMNYSVSQIQKYSYKYEEQPLEEAISSLRTTMGRDVANSVYLPGMDLFFTMFYRIPSGLSYPCFPKPLATLVGAKTGLGRCDTEQQLRKSIDALVRRSSTISILVEEYKHIDQEFALMGVSDGTTVHIPGILRISSLASGTHYGVAIKGEIIPIEGFEDLLESFKVFVRETSYVGIFDIDFYRSGSRFYFCEMNFRYGGSGYAYTRSGVNLPAMFVHAINGESIDTSVMVKDKAVYLNERMCLDDWYKGYITTREFKTLLRSRDISFIADEEDPEPERMFRKLILQNGFKRIIKKCLGRK